MTQSLSPATIRNVMADLEDAGLLFSPHTSAGRLPTEAGLRLFVDGILEVGNLSDDERKRIEAQCAGTSSSVDKVLEEATTTLSGLTGFASLVFAPKTDSPLKAYRIRQSQPGARPRGSGDGETASSKNRLIFRAVDLAAVGAGAGDETFSARGWSVAP